MAEAGVCIVGAAGRMGQRLVRLLLEGGAPGLKLSSALVSERSARRGVDAAAPLGRPPCGVLLGSDARLALSQAKVVIDFSTPAAAPGLGPLCSELGIPWVVGSTGLEEAALTALDAAAQQTAVLQAANFSVGVNVLLELARLATARLGPGFDLEIFELHHRQKRDAPSGTALALAHAASTARPELHQVLGRQGGAPRAGNELGIAVGRGGDVPGEHTVFLLGSNERLELTHRAGSADIFAQGALRAATWLLGKPAGRYRMTDVLGMS